MRAKLFFILIIALACTDNGPTYVGPPIVSVVVSAEVEQIRQGQTAQLATVITDVTGHTVSSPVVWRSSNTNIATISQTGVVTAVSPGNVAFSAAIGGKLGWLTLEVTDNSADVTTSGLVFSPPVAYIDIGGTVRFAIYGDDHNVIWDPSVLGAPADIQIVRDTVVSRTFNTRGTFPYDCTLHPGMSGEVVVQ